MLYFLYGRGTSHNNASSWLLGQEAVYLFLRGQKLYPQHSASQTITNPRPRTNLLQELGDKCIQNYPERVLPTLILYRNGEIKGQLVARAGRNTRRFISEITTRFVPQVRDVFNKFPYKHEGQRSYLRQNSACNKYLMGLSSSCGS